MPTVSDWIYTPQAVRELDRIAIEEQGVPGYELMTRAATATFDAARARFPGTARWLVLCGGGNNAGDGYVIARLARKVGIEVACMALTDPGDLQGDAATAFHDLQLVGGRVQSFDANADPGGFDLLVDALLGTGLDRAVEGAYLDAVGWINAAGLPVVAVDIPSGLHGGSGKVLGAAVHADLTVTYVGLKQGLFLAAGPDHCGELVFDPLGIGAIPAERVPPSLRIAGPADLAALLPARRRSAHKGDFGHVLLIGGNRGMAGALALAGEAALRAGAGLVSVATRANHAGWLLARRPELMVHGVDRKSDLEPLLEKADVVAIGPGLGRDKWAHRLLAKVLSTDLPLVLDADALNLLADEPPVRKDWILTPHPGEAARLLGCSTAEVQAGRLEALGRLHMRYGGVSVLKGHATLVGDGKEIPRLVAAGNPGMATGGSGDVLTGVTAALRAQRPDAPLIDVAAVAAYAHAAAGDRAARAGERGLLPTDLCAELRACLNPISP